MHGDESRRRRGYDVDIPWRRVVRDGKILARPRVRELARRLVHDLGVLGAPAVVDAHPALERAAHRVEHARVDACVPELSDRGRGVAAAAASLRPLQVKSSGTRPRPRRRCGPSRWVKRSARAPAVGFELRQAVDDLELGLRLADVCERDAARQSGEVLAGDREVPAGHRARREEDRRPSSARRRPPLMIFAASECWRRPLQARGKARIAGVATEVSTTQRRAARASRCPSSCRPRRSRARSCRRASCVSCASGSARRRAARGSPRRRGARLSASYLRRRAGLDRYTTSQPRDYSSPRNIHVPAAASLRLVSAGISTSQPRRRRDSSPEISTRRNYESPSATCPRRPCSPARTPGAGCPCSRPAPRPLRRRHRARDAPLVASRRPLSTRRPLSPRRGRAPNAAMPWPRFT